tara:strand:- start:193 stop:621 length:429 start_codon:yes stop_codon:yes gene_type:complete
MKQEYKDWFIENRSLKQYRYKETDRSYSSTNIYYKDVPFHQDLKQHIYSYDIVSPDTEYNVYHIHTWNEGDYFNEHTDNNLSRKWAYVCELKASECNTKLKANGEDMIEGVFDSNTLHTLPMIKKGVRISLTIFGRSKPTLL